MDLYINVTCTWRITKTKISCNMYRYTLRMDTPVVTQKMNSGFSKCDSTTTFYMYSFHHSAPYILNIYNIYKHPHMYRIHVRWVSFLDFVLQPDVPAEFPSRVIIV